MVVNARIADLIREGRPDEIPDAIAEGQFFGMQTFQMALIEAVLDGTIDREVAAKAASNRHDFLVAFERELKVRNAQIATAEKKGDAPDEAPVPEVAPTGLRVARPVG
jgi:Tfp pilus assembly ATPase PilU